MKRKKKSSFWLGVWTTLLILNVAFLATFGMMYLWEEEEIKHSSEIKNITFYKNLSVEEIEHIEEIMNKVNPLFLYDQKKIIFTKYTPDICDNCGGANVGKGREVWIKYMEDENKFRERITHELMHTYLVGEKNGNDWNHPLHKIVFELAEQQVAFK